MAIRLFVLSEVEAEKLGIQFDPSFIDRLIAAAKANFSRIVATFNQKRAFVTMGGVRRICSWIPVWLPVAPASSAPTLLKR